MKRFASFFSDMVPNCLKRQRSAISSEEKLKIEAAQLREKLAQLDTVQSDNAVLQQKVAQLNKSLIYKSTQLKYAIKHVQIQEQDIKNKDNTICNLKDIKYSLVQNKVLIEGDLQAIKKSYSTVQEEYGHHIKISKEMEDKWKMENNKIRLELEKEKLLKRVDEEMHQARKIFLQHTLQEKDELEKKTSQGN